jgi:aspartate/glutamate racemase
MNTDAENAGASSAFESELAALCVSRLNEAGRPWRESLNQSGGLALSCMHAIRQRDRLGSGNNGGIPLWAELKSIVGIARSSDGKTAIPYAAHTRANTRIDERSLISALGLDPEETSLQSIHGEDMESGEGMSAATLRERRERWFGLVNPFTADRVLSELGGLDLSISDVVQLFDVSLSLPGGVPDTVMTNLGDRKRAMELSPADLIGAVRALSCVTHLEEIAVPCPIWLGQSGKHQKDVFMNWPPPVGPRIGILTGNGPESGLTLWQDIIATVRGLYPQVPDVLMPDVLVQSVPGMGLSMDLVAREQEVREIVLGGIRDLLRLDCKLITVACNTTIYFEPEITALCTEFGARFVSIAEAAVPAAARALATEPPGTGVGLIGIGPVSDLEGGFSGYARYLAEAEIAVATCAADDLKAFAFKIKNQPDDAKARAKTFGKLINGLPSTTGVVILALTEASIVFRRDVVPNLLKRADSRLYIDALAELGKYVAFIYLTSGYLESAVCQITDEPMVAGKLSEQLDGTDKQLEPATTT